MPLRPTVLVPRRRLRAADRRVQAAVECQDAEGVRAALADGADPNRPVRTLLDQWQPLLHRAGELGDARIVAHLVRAGARLEQRDAHARTVLCHVAGRRAAPVVRVLMEAGADSRARAPYGDRALHIAAENGQSQVVAVLLAAGADRNALNDWQQTALDLAVERCASVGVVRQLLAAGASPHRPARAGHSMIHRACLVSVRTGGPVIVALLAAGARLTPDDLAILAAPPVEQARAIVAAVRAGQLPAATLLPMLDGPHAALRTLAFRGLPRVIRGLSAADLTPWLSSRNGRVRALAIQALALAPEPHRPSASPATPDPSRPTKSRTR